MISQQDDDVRSCMPSARLKSTTPSPLKTVKVASMNIYFPTVYILRILEDSGLGAVLILGIYEVSEDESRLMLCFYEVGGWLVSCCMQIEF